MKKVLLFLIVPFFIACQEAKPKFPKDGTWRAALKLDKGKEIPFILEWQKGSKMIIQNAEERIEVKDITFFGDSVYIEHPVFEGIFKGIYSNDTISGNFIKPSLDRVVPFYMYAGKEKRFKIKGAPTVIINGAWETVFSPNKPADRYIAKGIFKQTGNKVHGTFRTTTGDYRYLDGMIQDDTLKLSTFDGAHAFLFEAKVTDSLMEGHFYSGNHWKEPFMAKLNNEYELPSTDSLTFIKEGYEKIEFTFKDTKGKEVSLADDRFKDKVVLVQIMGTWCPNCLDETKYFSEYYKKNKSENLEMVALAFEYAKTEEGAIKSINKFKKGVGVPYPVLLAQYGSASKLKANKKLPMLNHVLSYPTTIFIDKTGKVRRIHTGFNGPATGKEYTKFTKEFEEFVGGLVKE
ncbi:hypothetical protein ULMS_21150 [Patiriisocius marinistellae]|uniref:Thioredoxin domain-containing protein n=1 Tax=Patiriisocius marinistellae TaxID=2494560 RepID=A0A5J4FV79_9FLAO|nr:TlpA disulfide reductase family protein [Patiriisocius marinistellae]GEQ86607.1 hypothetical protein ULMS_21150 [Patiriisocius marinistellae]